MGLILAARGVLGAGHIGLNDSNGHTWQAPRSLHFVFDWRLHLSLRCFPVSSTFALQFIFQGNFAIKKQPQSRQDLGKLPQTKMPSK